MSELEEQGPCPDSPRGDKIWECTSLLPYLDFCGNSQLRKSLRVMRPNQPGLCSEWSGRQDCAALQSADIALKNLGKVLNPPASIYCAVQIVIFLTD